MINQIDKESLFKSNIKLGLCCINNQLSKSKNKISCNRTCIRKTFTVEKAKQLAIQNIEDIIPLLKWNDIHNIKHYRMSSNMLPHYTDPCTEKYTLDFAMNSFEKVGVVINNLNHRITMHPGQFCQIGAKSRDIFEKTIEDLKMHADIMDNMNINPDSGIICIHGGGIYGDKENTIRRWVEQYDELPLNVKNRLAIEHCEKCYSIIDVLNISEQTGIPVIYDNLHYECYNQLHPLDQIDNIDDILPEVVETWNSRNSVPLMHIAQQKLDSKVGAHADYVDKIPEEIFKIIQELEINIDIEVEAKAKEDAIFKLHAKYL